MVKVVKKRAKKHTERGKALSAEDWVGIKDYLDGGNATHAYYAMGRNGKSPGTNAYRWLMRPQVQKAIADAREKVITRIADKLEITVDKVLGDLEDERVGAMNAAQFAAAIKATELHGRHIGMFSEDYSKDKDAPMIHITVAGGAQIAVVGREQGVQLPSPLPQQQLEDDMEYLTDADLLGSN